MYLACNYFLLCYIIKYFKLSCHTTRGARCLCFASYVALLCVYTVHTITLCYYRAIWLNPTAVKRDAACIVIIPRNVIESSIEKHSNASPFPTNH